MLRGLIESTLAGGACWLCAQATTTAPVPPGFELNPWSAGAAGFTVWYAWYTASRVIPQLVKDFREEAQLAREENRADREAYLQGLNAITDRDREIEKLRNPVK